MWWDQTLTRPVDRACPGHPLRPAVQVSLFEFEVVSGAVFNAWLYPVLAVLFATKGRISSCWPLQEWRCIKCSICSYQYHKTSSVESSTSASLTGGATEQSVWPVPGEACEESTIPGVEVHTGSEQWIDNT